MPLKRLKLLNTKTATLYPPMPGRLADLVFCLLQTVTCKHDLACKHRRTRLDSNVETTGNQSAEVTLNSGKGNNPFGACLLHSLSVIQFFSLSLLSSVLPCSFLSVSISFVLSSVFRSFFLSLFRYFIPYYFLCLSCIL
jgi:hypothetical protein